MKTARQTKTAAMKTATDRHDVRDEISSVMRKVSGYENAARTKFLRFRVGDFFDPTKKFGSRLENVGPTFRTGPVPSFRPKLVVVTFHVISTYNRVPSETFSAT